MGVSFEEIKAAVLAAPEEEPMRLFDSVHAELDARHVLSPAQAEDLARREAELDAHPDDGEDGDFVKDRRFAKYAPSVPRGATQP